MPNVFASLPCTDVDVMGYCVGDFATLTSKSERVAFGTDGTISAGSFDLSSAFPFLTQGVQVGHVAVLESCTSTDVRGNATPKALSDVMPVASVANGTLTLERFGYGSGQGAYPGLGTAMSGVRFYVPSLVGQINAEYTEVVRALGVVTTADLINPTDLKKITILKVLRTLYFAQSREEKDIYWSKAMDLDKQITNEFSGVGGLMAIYGSGTSQSHRPVAAAPIDDPSWRVPRDYSVNDWTNYPRFPLS